MDLMDILLYFYDELVSLTIVLFCPPVSASHRRMVWSHDALHSSSASIQSTEDTASLWPETVMRGV